MLLLKSLLEETSSCNPYVVTYNNDFFSCDNLRLLEKGEKHIEDNVLYIGYTSTFKECCKNPVKSAFFLVRDRPISYKDILPDSYTIVEYPAGTDILMLGNRIKELFYNGWDYFNTSSELLKSLLYGNDLSILAEKAAKILKNPVLIMDASCSLLAYSKSVKYEDASWCQHIEMGGFSFEYSAAIRRFNASIVIPKDSTPYMQKNDISPARRLVSRLYSDGIHLGFFVTLETNQFFSEIKLELYKLISDVIANILKSNKKLYIEKGYPNYESIFIDLINGHFVNKSSFLRVISQTKLIDKNYFQLLCIDISDYSSADIRDNFLLHSMEAILGRTWLFYYNENIIAVVDLKGDESGISKKSQLSDFFKKYKLHTGLSCIFNDLYQLNQFYQQGKRALEVAKILHFPGVLYDYEDCKLYDMFSIIQKTGELDGNDLKGFCHSIIYRIQAFDKTHSSEYLKTLWTYLNSSKNIIKTAKKLHIHKNTATYRIQKLEQLFSIDLTDDSLLFKLYYSYLLLSYLDGEGQ